MRLSLRLISLYLTPEGSFRCEKCRLPYGVPSLSTELTRVGHPTMVKVATLPRGMWCLTSTPTPSLEGLHFSLSARRGDGWVGLEKRGRSRCCAPRSLHAFGGEEGAKRNDRHVCDFPLATE